MSDFAFRPGMGAPGECGDCLYPYIRSEHASFCRSASPLELGDAGSKKEKK